jgi:acetyl-CoA carboxylase carboxyltransferase component
MILQTVELLPGQEAAFEEKIGSEQTMLPCSGAVTAAKASDRQAAAQLMRYQLYLLDRSQHRMSIEDYADMLLQKAEVH